MRRDLLPLKAGNVLLRRSDGLPLIPLALVLVALTLGALACDFSTNTAATALAPTPVPPAGTLVTNGGAIQSGDQMAAILRQQGEEHRYTFQGEAGQAVTITMQRGPDGTLDSYLELRAPDGTALITNDDSGGNLNSLISNFVLPDTGEYTILSYGFNHTSTGSYALVMTLGTPAPSPTPPPTPITGGGAITLGETVRGEFTVPSQSDQWTFWANAGDIVTIDMRSLSANPALDCYLELIDPYNNTLVVDDDGGDNLNARIANYLLPSDGQYTIRAATFNSAGIGRYELTLAEGQPPTPTPLPPTPGPSPTPFDQQIELGEVIEDTLPPRTAGNRYVFQVEEPVMVEILLEGGDQSLPLYADLIDPNRVTVQSLSGYGGSSSVYLAQMVALQTTGEYQLRVYGYADYAIDYALVIVPGELLTMTGGEIEYGQGVSGELIAAGQHEEWTFEGRAGDIVTIIMNAVNMDSFLVLNGPDGTQLAADDDGNGALDSRISNVSLPRDGTYTIIARCLNNTGYGPYRLLLFRTGGAVVEP